jgi:N-acyl-D-aspartate/D-glutamate deacylase
MPDFDKIIRNGTIVDGTGGTPAFKGDVAIKNGKIAMISGRIQGSATEELDATDCVVAPGAIDLHNHYDLQLNWDPYMTMSGWHGVTSVAIGQCGFGFAPCKPEDREAAMRLLTRIEAIPLRTMELGLGWEWETFPQWMDLIDSKPLGVNVGALVPFNPLRLYVMGVNESRERVDATPEETKQMQGIVHEAMTAGAFGWSSMKTLLNRPDDGRFIPSQVASNAEYLALAETMSEFGVGSIGWTRGQAERPIPEGEPDLLAGFGIEASSTGLQFDPVEGDVHGEGRDNFLIEMTKASGRPFQWGGVNYSEAAPERYKEQLAYLERANQEGARMFAQASGVQISPIFELAEYNGFDALPNWIDPFVGTPEERIAKLNAPGVRDRMKQDVGGAETKTGAAGSGQGGTADVASNWAKMRVVEVRKDSNLQYEGMTVAELAEATGKHPMDAMLDLALDEDLTTEFSTDPTTGTNDEAMKEILNHPFTHPCVSDGGAHVRYLTVGVWPVNFLATWARDKQIMSLEKAHYKMSALPASIAGFTDRGVIKEGFAADIIVYNLDELGLQYDTPIYDDDFPGGERRLIQKAKGIRYTLVNGDVTFTEGTICTDATPGKLLRSYDMVSR